MTDPSASPKRPDRPALGLGIALVTVVLFACAVDHRRPTLAH